MDISVKDLASFSCLYVGVWLGVSRRVVVMVTLPLTFCYHWLAIVQDTVGRLVLSPLNVHITGHSLVFATADYPCCRARARVTR